MFVASIYYFVLILGLITVVGLGNSFWLYKGSLLQRILISPILGFATITLFTAYTSYAGFGTNETAGIILLILIITSSTGLIRNRDQLYLEFKNCFKFLIPLIIFAFANACILLAPTVFENSPYLFNDHTTYLSISEYVRDTGYSVPAQSDAPLWENNTSSYQTIHFRMGAQFFLAALSSIYQVQHSIMIYPALLGVVAFCFMLAISFLHFSVRGKQPNTVEHIFVLIFSLISVTLNSYNLAIGFLPQTLGVILFIVLTGLLYTAITYEHKSYALTSFIFAALVLTYHEITLLYSVGLAVVIAWQYWPKKTRAWVSSKKMIIAHMLALLLSPISTKEFFWGIQISSQVNDVGWNVPYSLLRYIDEIFGQGISYFLPDDLTKFITIPGSYVVFLIICILLRKRFWADKKPILEFILLLFSPAILGLIIYTYTVPNPFTTTMGHTWRIYKIVSWSYWIIPFITGLAIFSYFKESLLKKVLTVLAMILLLPAIGGNLYANYLRQKYEMQLYTNNYTNPLEDFEFLAIHKKDYSPANIIDYKSHPNYTYLLVSILKDISVTYPQTFGNQLDLSTSTHFYPWVNYRREHSNTSVALDIKAGFNIYPKGSSTVFLAEGFSSRQIDHQNHFATMSTTHGVITAIVPQGHVSQFSTTIFNRNETTGNIEIKLGNDVLYSSQLTNLPIIFTSPALPTGKYDFHVNYRDNDNTSSMLNITFQNITISEINK